LRDDDIFSLYSNTALRGPFPEKSLTILPKSIFAESAAMLMVVIMVFLLDQSLVGWLPEKQGQKKCQIVH
jgi:cell division protein FtsX